MSIHKVSLLLLIGFWPISGIEIASAQAFELNDALRVAAQKIYAKSKGKYKSIGVLKFQVQKDNGELDDNMGTINLSIARRLELALIAAQRGEKGPPKVEDEVLIIKNASLTIAALKEPKGVTHLTENGRKEFFKHQYKPYWGLNKEISADAFITGTATISKDLKKINIKLRWFNNTVEEALDEFECDNSANELVHTGHNFVVRGNVQPPSVAAIASAKEMDNDTNPFDPKAKPLVILRIMYDGKEIPTHRWKGSNGEINELTKPSNPKATQPKVSFILERTQEERNLRLAVVLKVNGVNTLYSEQTPQPLNCSKWLLEKSGDVTNINGYQDKDNKTAKQFTLFTPEDYKNRFENNSLYYGQDTGYIQMIVFKEGKNPLPKSPSPVEIGMRAEYQGNDLELPETWDKARTRIMKPSYETLNLIGPGGSITSPIQIVTFNAYPEPVMSVAIKYWEGASKKK